MRRSLSRKFTSSFFATLVETSLYHAFVILYISDVKNIDNVYITKMVAINFIISLIATPLFGELIEKVKDKSKLIKISSITYLLSILFLVAFKVRFLILIGNILYNTSKLLSLRLQEMFGAQAHYEGNIDFGQARSNAALAYAFSPLLVTVILNMLNRMENLYIFVFVIMVVMILFNTYSMISISNDVDLPIRNNESSFISTLKQRDGKTWFYLSFVIIANVFYNTTNNFATTFQSIYYQEIFKATTLLGLVILFGSILEWPVMKKTSNVIDALGYIKTFMLLSVIQIFRWALYYYAGYHHSLNLFFIASSLNGVLQAIYIPLFTTFVRNISTDAMYGNNITIIGVFSSLLMWSISQFISIMQNIFSLQEMFIVLIVLTSLWLLIMVLYQYFLNLNEDNIKNVK